MHGTGNDFVLIDGRKQPVALDAATVQRLANRHTGIGCDQLLVLEPSTKADARMLIYNADGSEISTCGNATRCVADFLMNESGKAEATIETGAGVRKGWRAEDGGVTANMGTPRWEWQDIPLSESRNTLHLGIEEGRLMDPVAVNIGNPHVIFFVRDLAHIHMAEWGEKLEHHPLFPARANISAVQVMAENHLKMVVWERGTGLTLACGSAACAAVVAGIRLGLLDAQVDVQTHGGRLTIAWRGGDSPVMMTGPAEWEFSGTFDPASGAWTRDTESAAASSRSCPTYISATIRRTSP